MNIKKRHWLLTTYLIFSISILSIMFFMLRFKVAGSAIEFTHKFPNVPQWVYYALRLDILLHIVSLIALFRWKKWGFYGAVAACIVSVIINLIMDGEIGEDLLGLLGIAILYGVLQIGGERKGWVQLE
jgi:hypothetical protein